MTQLDRAKLAVVIVSYGNPSDVDRCLKSLARSTWTEFEVFVCENRGQDAFVELFDQLVGESGILTEENGSEPVDSAGGQFVIVAKCRFRGRANIVRLGAAGENLGYAGGVNAWLGRFLAQTGWQAVLVLNPDTEVAETCLSELMAKASEGFGMVGGTLVYDEAPDRIINYGLRWSRLTGRVTAVGRGCSAATPPSSALIASLDAISGACVLVTRAFVDEIGLMNEGYFLYMEDLDWGQRRGRHQIGFAPAAIVRHVGSTSIGSAMDPKERSPLSIYLAARNSILHARRWVGLCWIVHFFVGSLQSLEYLLHGSFSAAKFVITGLLDGARGKTGRPTF